MCNPLIMAGIGTAATIYGVVQQKKQAKRALAHQEEQDDIREDEREEDIRRQDDRDEAEAERRRQEDARREAREQAIRGGQDAVTNTFASVFTPNYYDQVRTGYTDWATPDLESDYEDAGKQLLMSLARSGNLGSSLRGEKEADAEAMYETGKDEIAMKADRTVSDLKSRVASRQSDLFSQAASVADPGRMTSMAKTATDELSGPVSYEGIGDPFAGLLSTLTTAYDSERRKRDAEFWRRRYGVAGGIGGSGSSTVVG